LLIKTFSLENEEPSKNSKVKKKQETLSVGENLGKNIRGKTSCRDCSDRNEVSPPPPQTPVGRLKSESGNGRKKRSVVYRGVTLRCRTQIGSVSKFKKTTTEEERYRTWTKVGSGQRKCNLKKYKRTRQEMTENKRKKHANQENHGGKYDI